MAQEAWVEFQRADPRYVIVPACDLRPGGLRPEAARRLAAGSPLAASALETLGRGFATYWARAGVLARRASPWPPPRRRHAAIVTGDPLAVPLDVPVLNHNAWLLFADDLGEHGSPELVAWLLAVADWASLTGELSMAPVRAAAWWILTPEEAEASFARGAQASTRPDAGSLRAVAESIPWLRRLGHVSLRPPRDAPGRPIPGTGLRVPPELEPEPPRLASACAEAVRDALARRRAAFRAPPGRAVAALGDWLRETRPPLLVAAGRERLVWDPEQPEALDALTAALAEADAVAVDAVHEDLRVVAAKTRRVHPLLERADARNGPAADETSATFEPGGHAWMHPRRGLLVYDLDEPHMCRRHGPPPPHARLMLGARCAHEWGHRADEAGLVACAAGEALRATRLERLADAFGEVLGRMPTELRAQEAADLARIARGRPEGPALAELLATRLPDYRANLFARRLASDLEAETYVQENVRCLRAEHPPGRRVRLLVRYVYEAQYLSAHLGMTHVPDPLDHLLALTGLEADLLGPGLLTLEDLCTLLERTAELCGSFEVTAAGRGALDGNGSG